MITNAVNGDDDVGGEGFVEGTFEKGDHGGRVGGKGERRKAKGDGREGKDMSHRSHKSYGAVLLLLALALFSHAGETANENGWRVWLEPKSSHAPVTLPIAGAERTELCAGFLEEEGPRPMTREELAGMGIEMARFAARARENAQGDLAGLKPRYVRNRKKVIEYAELHSERPVVAGAVLAPKFLALFRDTLGEKVLVVVPNRFTAFVFPALAGNHGDYAPMVLAALRATAWPVSVEVLEISSEGVRCVGRYKEP